MAGLPPPPPPPGSASAQTVVMHADHRTLGSRGEHTCRYSSTVSRAPGLGCQSISCLAPGSVGAAGELTSLL